MIIYLQSHTVHAKSLKFKTEKVHHPAIQLGQFYAFESRCVEKNYILNGRWIIYFKKTAGRPQKIETETKITKLSTDIAPINEYQVKKSNFKVTGSKKCKKVMKWLARVMHSIECPASSFSYYSSYCSALIPTHKHVLLPRCFCISPNSSTDAWPMRSCVFACLLYTLKLSLLLDIAVLRTNHSTSTANGISIRTTVMKFEEYSRRLKCMEILHEKESVKNLLYSGQLTKKKN